MERDGTLFRLSPCSGEQDSERQSIRFARKGRFTRSFSFFDD